MASRLTPLDVPHRPKRWEDPDSPSLSTSEVTMWWYTIDWHPEDSTEARLLLLHLCLASNGYVKIRPEHWADRLVLDLDVVNDALDELLDLGLLRYDPLFDDLVVGLVSEVSA